MRPPGRAISPGGLPRPARTAVTISAQRQRLRVGHHIGFAATGIVRQHMEDGGGEVLHAQQRAPVRQRPERQRDRQRAEPHERPQVSLHAGTVDQHRAQHGERHAGARQRDFGGELGAPVGIGRQRRVGLGQHAPRCRAGLRPDGRDQDQPPDSGDTRCLGKLRGRAVIDAVVARLRDAWPGMRDAGEMNHEPPCRPAAAANRPHRRGRHATLSRSAGRMALERGGPPPARRTQPPRAPAPPRGR